MPKLSSLLGIVVPCVIGMNKPLPFVWWKVSGPQIDGGLFSLRSVLRMTVSLFTAWSFYLLLSRNFFLVFLLTTCRQTDRRLAVFK